MTNRLGISYSLALLIVFTALFSVKATTSNAVNPKDGGDKINTNASSSSSSDNDWRDSIDQMSINLVAARFGISSVQVTNLLELMDPQEILRLEREREEREEERKEKEEKREQLIRSMNEEKERQKCELQAFEEQCARLDEQRARAKLALQCQAERASYEQACSNYSKCMRTREWHARELARNQKRVVELNLEKVRLYQPSAWVNQTEEYYSCLVRLDFANGNITEHQSALEQARTQEELARKHAEEAEVMLGIASRKAEENLQQELDCKKREGLKAVRQELKQLEQEIEGKLQQIKQFQQENSASRLRLEQIELELKRLLLERRERELEAKRQQLERHEQEVKAKCQRLGIKEWQRC